MAPIITAEGVNREFKTGKDIIYALREVTLSIETNTLTILRGRSGSGKTTLINVLGALDKPTGGKVFFNKVEITNLTEGVQDKLRRDSMGFVFQSFALISLMSAYENVELPLRLLGIKPKERRARVEECLAKVGLHKRMNHRPSELSGGEQQRVAIARAIVHRPKVVFADEPTAELDTHMAIQVMKLFRELVENEGITVVMTTHDPNMMELADQVYTLEDGQIIDNYSL
ncbi:MAG: ABC transporter ATP-binding protein [Clostridiaceae bacterium]|nr:ABC transporter ATP-binding protein [Clostridiaceae bacterium]